MANPTGKGGFRRGVSGNASGRPKRDRTLGSLAREYTQDALTTLVDIMRNGERDADRLKAAECLLNRGYGRIPAPAAEVQEHFNGHMVFAPQRPTMEEWQKMVEDYRNGNIEENWTREGVS